VSTASTTNPHLADTVPRPDGPSQPRPRRPRWWSRPRLRSAVVIAVLGVVIGVSRVIAHLQTEWLWYHELGQDRVFWTLLVAKWLAAGLVAVATTMFALVNFWIVERASPRGGSPRADTWLRRGLLGIYLAVALVAGAFAGAAIMRGGWLRILLWMHRRDFGVTDPEFHKDVGFYVFSLPLYQQAVAWLLVLTVVTLLTTVVGHVATGAIRPGRPLAISRAARIHVCALGVLLLLLLAGQHRLGQYALELPHPGEAPGGYTDMHVQIRWLGGLAVVCLAAAAALVYSAFRRSLALPAAVVAIVVAAEVVNPSVLPAFVQRYSVDPQTLTRERPYIARTIHFTQLAYGLHDVTTRGLAPGGTISPAELRANQDVLRNIQLWDDGVIGADIDEHQSLGSYYRFPSTTVDRYRDAGGERTMILAERQLDLRRLDPSGRTWGNDRTAYTHGYGLVAVPAGGVDVEGRPTYTNDEFNEGPPATRVRQPRLYFGVQPPRAEPWVVADANRGEVEKPLAGDAPATKYHYDGPAGIRLGGLLRRAVLALRFGETNLLISESLNSGSRLIMRRDVRERVKALAPFLRWDERAQVVVVGGRIQFLLHGATTSDTYPYAQRIRIGRSELNYMRSAALAVVDGFTGKVTIYATDEDPILDAWRDVFGSLFTPASRMPAAIREHLRYPEALFDVQSQVWEAFHADEIDDFYTRVDAWQRPADLSGPLDRVGGIRFRRRTDGSLDPEEPQDNALRAPRVRATYVLARLPGERRQRFMLTTTFTPHSQENLAGFLTGTIDPAGRPRLAQLTVPRSRLVLGPAQVTRLILNTPAVSDQVRLLNQETTDLGDRSVDAVEIGQTRMVPIGDALLYVQPIYVTAHGSGVTRLRLVTVYLNGRVGYGRTLDQALARATPAPVSGSPTARR
jgi:uncharacterized protein